MTNRNQEPGTRNQGFRGLLAWQKADELASEVYRALAHSAADRWLKSQAVRAAISAPANIAEGYGRGTLGDYIRFLDIARGPLAELEYYLHLLARKGMLDPGKVKHLDALQHEAARLLHGLWKSLKEKTKNGTWDRTVRVSGNATVVDYGDDAPINPSFLVPCSSSS